MSKYALMPGASEPKSAARTPVRVEIAAILISCAVTPGAPVPVPAGQVSDAPCAAPAARTAVLAAPGTPKRQPASTATHSATPITALRPNSVRMRIPSITGAPGSSGTLSQLDRTFVSTSGLRRRAGTADADVAG